MRVLMLSTDRNIFEKGSDARTWHIAYGECFDELHICVGSLRSNNFVVENLSPHVTAYPIHWSSRALWSSHFLTLMSLMTRSDIVVAQDPIESGLPAFVVSLFSRAPLYIQIHTDLFGTGYQRLSVRNAWHTRLAGVALRRAKRIRVVSSKIKRDVLHRYSLTTPITVLPIYVDTVQWGTLEKKKHPRFGLAALAVGRLEKEKNFDVAIRAIYEAREAGHDIGLVIVGSGSEEKSLRSLVAELRLAEYVEFVSHQHDLRPYYSFADVVLVPSEYEGYGRVIVEALAAHVPVLATDVGIARESGAIIAEKRLFTNAFLEWVLTGPRRAHLQNYPYTSFTEFRDRYCNDIKAALQE